MPFIKLVCCASAPHDDDDAALLAGVPWRWDRHGFGTAPAFGIAMVGGLLLSQLLTLYTTPVIYLWFDRLATRFSRGIVAGRVLSRSRRSKL